MPGIDNRPIAESKYFLPDRTPLRFIVSAVSRSAQRPGEHGIPHECHVLVDQAHAARGMTGSGLGQKRLVADSDGLAIDNATLDFGSQSPHEGQVELVDQSRDLHRLADFGQGPDVISVAVRQQDLLDFQLGSFDGPEDFLGLESRIDDHPLSGLGAADNVSVHLKVLPQNHHLDDQPTHRPARRVEREIAPIRNDLQFLRMQPQHFGQTGNRVPIRCQFVVFNLLQISLGQVHPPGQVCQRHLLAPPRLSHNIPEFVFELHVHGRFPSP